MLKSVTDIRRYLKFKTKAARQIASDIWLTAPAVFVVTGIVVACLKFWLWVFSWV
jgi:hypothetical protein